MLSGAGGISRQTGSGASVRAAAGSGGEARPADRGAAESGLTTGGAGKPAETSQRKQSGDRQYGEAVSITVSGNQYGEAVSITVSGNQYGEAVSITHYKGQGSYSQRFVNPFFASKVRIILSC